MLQVQGWEIATCTNYLAKEEGEKMTNQHMPNCRLYLRLLIVSVLIAVGSLAFTACPTASSLVSNIGCGGIASVVVAWLIEYSN